MWACGGGVGWRGCSVSVQSRSFVVVGVVRCCAAALSVGVGLVSRRGLVECRAVSVHGVCSVCWSVGRRGRLGCLVA